MIILTTLVKVKEVKTKARSGLINEWEVKKLGQSVQTLLLTRFFIKQKRKGYYQRRIIRGKTMRDLFCFLRDLCKFQCLCTSQNEIKARSLGLGSRGSRRAWDSEHRCQGQPSIGRRTPLSLCSERHKRTFQSQVCRGTGCWRFSSPVAFNFSVKQAFL